MLSMFIESCSIMTQESYAVGVHARRVSFSVHDGVDWNSGVHYLPRDGDGVVSNIVLAGVPSHWLSHIRVINETAAVLPSI